MTDSLRYAVSLQIATPRTIAAVHAHLPLRDVPATFMRYLNQVYAAGKTGLVHLDGQNVFLYLDCPPVPGDAHVAFGVGITAPFSTVGAVEPTPLPTGLVACVTHMGSYSRLGAAHTAVSEWCERAGRRKAGPSWEVYGHWTDDEARLRTDVYYLLQPES